MLEWMNPSPPSMRNPITHHNAQRPRIEPRQYHGRPGKPSMSSTHSVEEAAILLGAGADRFARSVSPRRPGPYQTDSRRSISPARARIKDEGTCVNNPDHFTEARGQYSSARQRPTTVTRALTTFDHRRRMPDAKHHSTTRRSRTAVAISGGYSC